jgi:hypothetical protein
MSAASSPIFGEFNGLVLSRLRILFYHVIAIRQEDYKDYKIAFLLAFARFRKIPEALWNSDKLSRTSQSVIPCVFGSRTPPLESPRGTSVSAPTTKYILLQLKQEEAAMDDHRIQIWNYSS